MNYPPDGPTKRESPSRERRKNVTRGKYAAKATLRREDNSVRAETETYQQAVKHLTTENALLKEQVSASRAAYKEEIRQLRAQLDQGLSPELLTLRKELERQRNRASEAEASRKASLEKQSKLIKFMVKLLHDLTGCTGLEALEVVTKALGLDKMIVGQSAGIIPSGNETRAAVATLQRARGYRSSSITRTNASRPEPTTLTSTVDQGQPDGECGSATPTQARASEPITPPIATDVVVTPRRSGRSAGC